MWWLNSIKKMFKPVMEDRKTLKQNKKFFDKIKGQKRMRNEESVMKMEQNTIQSLVKNSLYHYDMLMALQVQIKCLEAQIKMLSKRNIKEENENE